MPQPKSEEQYPLLAFIVGDEELSKNNKRFFTKRLEGITSGASTVITEWPNYIASCWVTTLLCTATLFIVTVLMMAIISSQAHLRLPRCTYYELSNETIYLVQNSPNWELHQLDILAEILEVFPNYKIHLTIIENNQSLYNHFRTRKSINDETQLNATELIKNIYSRKNRTDTNFEEFQKNFTNIYLTFNKYKTAFLYSPIFWKWTMFSTTIKNFALRALFVWEYGGLSFDIDLLHKLKYVSNNNTIASNNTNHNLNNSTVNVNNNSSFNATSTTTSTMTSVAINQNIVQLRNYLVEAKMKYENMTVNNVLVESEGLLMGSKIQCHSFFGKLLTDLAKNHFSSIQKILLKSISEFYAIVIICKLP